MKSKDELIDTLIALAFEEDLGDGDHTTLSTIPASAKGRSRLLVKEDGILYGVEVARRVLNYVDPELKMEVLIEDGTPVKAGDVAFTVSGSVRSLLIAERTMLNLMQRLSGIATTTHRYQECLKGLHTRVLDTRKTTPGLRMLEKEAVAAGGGVNHRIGLFDMILIKDNHIDFVGGIEKAILAAQRYRIDEGRPELKIEVEVRSLGDIRRVLAVGGVDRIMFDNFTPEMTRQAVELVDGQCETESSGGITLDTLRDYGEAGVDYISVGALTHSVKGLDLSFKADTK